MRALLKQVRCDLDLVTRSLAVALLAIALAGCARKTESTQPERHYPLVGRIVALNTRDQTATVDAAAIPSFMEAMTMEYPIKSRTEFAKLHVGDKITATVDVRDDGLYSLSDIHPQGSGAK